MRLCILTSTLLTMGISLPSAAQTGGDYNAQWLIYSVNQVCQAWSNGIARCFPVALVGPAPNYAARNIDSIMPQPQAAAVNPSNNPYLAYTQYAPKPTAATDTPWSSDAAPVEPPAPAIESTPLASPPALAEVVKPEPVPQAIDAEPALVKLEDTKTHFNFDSAELTEAGRDALDAWLVDAPKDIPILITGHADRLGPSIYNQKLSRRRAVNVMRYLTDKGMRPNDIKVAAKGESQPVVTCKGGATPKTKACLAPNRRVEIKAR